MSGFIKLRIVLLQLFSATILLSAQQNVGIGTTSPTHRLHIAGKNEALRIQGEHGPTRFGAKMNFGEGDHVRLIEFGDDSLQIFARAFLNLAGQDGTIKLDGTTGNILAAGNFVGIHGGHIELHSGQITLADKVGIRVFPAATPLHVAKNMIVLFGGDTLGDPMFSPDPKFMFLPNKGGAVRIGELRPDGSIIGGTGNFFWDPANIGWASVAIGNNTKASGAASVALGIRSEATNFGAIALGHLSRVRGNSGVAAGYYTRADAFLSCAVGAGNVGGGQANLWNDLDPIFEVGNSLDTSNRSNALTVLKNARVGVNTASPSAMLHVEQPNAGIGNGLFLNLAGVGHWEIGTGWSGEYNMYFNNIRKAYLSSHGVFKPQALHLPGIADVGLQQDGELLIGSAAGWNLSIDNNEIMARNNGNPNALILQKDGGSVGIGRVPTLYQFEVNGDASKNSGGDWQTHSDARLKDKIEQLNGKDMLAKLLNLRGVTFEWNDQVTRYERPKGRQYGLVAQDIQKVFPKLVKSDKDGYLQTGYSTYDAMYIETIRALHNRIIVLEQQNTMLVQELVDLKEENQEIFDLIKRQSRQFQHLLDSRERQAENEF